MGNIVSLSSDYNYNIVCRLLKRILINANLRREVQCWFDI